MRSHDTPRNFDEWPNLSEVDARPRFPDGEPVGPLSVPLANPVYRARLILALVFIAGALLVRACSHEVTDNVPTASARP